jgi:hypothetical protein
MIRLRMDTATFTYVFRQWQRLHLGMRNAQHPTEANTTRSMLAHHFFVLIQRATGKPWKTEDKSPFRYIMTGVSLASGHHGPSTWTQDPLTQDGRRVIRQLAREWTRRRQRDRPLLTDFEYTNICRDSKPLLCQEAAECMSLPVGGGSKRPHPVVSLIPIRDATANPLRSQLQHNCEGKNNLLVFRMLLY